MLIPIYGFLQGDALGLVVLVHDYETANDFANNLMQAAAMRVKPFEDHAVYFNGSRLEPEAILGQAGVSALDRLDVVRENGTHENGTHANGAHQNGDETRG